MHPSACSPYNPAAEPTRGRFAFEPTMDKGRSEPDRLGNGCGHTAFAVAILAKEHERSERPGFPAAAKGLSQEGRPPARFFFAQDPDGDMIQVLRRQGRRRRAALLSGGA
jgi:lactoylglutathione lyase